MTLGDKQREFTRHFRILLQHIEAAGYEGTLGDAYRSPKAFGEMGEPGPYGRDRSAHKNRLAVDLNLFKDGLYLDQTEDHRPIGEYWEALHPENVWGGRFQDGNHYSRRHNGIA